MADPAASRGGLHPSRLAAATALMMAAVLASRFVGYLRDAYISGVFGAGPTVDAYVTAFRIPDWLNYLVAGGSLSITFITVLHPFFEQRREREGYELFSTVATFLGLLLTAGVALAEWWAPVLLHWYQPHFSAAELAVCVHLTRILLPAQLFFCLGALLAGVLYVRGQFLAPALVPLVYNVSIIAGGVLLHRRLGIAGLAWGALAGAGLGPFLLPLCGAVRSGLAFRVRLRFADPAFRRWLRLTLPLMIGVSLATADEWIIGALAGIQPGGISHFYYAKRLIGVPIAVLGQAVGQATMPFFSRLATLGDWAAFRVTLDRAVQRAVLGALLLSSLLGGLALPLVRLVYLHGRFTPADSAFTASYLVVFALSLLFWSAQALYARAFYASGDTFTPMAAGTVITAASIPLYFGLRRAFGLPGLAWASDIGIAVLAVTLAVLLRRRGRMQLDRRLWRELPRVALLALGAGLAAWQAVARLEHARSTFLRELLIVALGGAVWCAAAALLARLLRLRDLRRDLAALLRRLLRLAPR